MKKEEVDKTLASARGNKSGVEHNSFLNDSQDQMIKTVDSSLPAISKQRRVTGGEVNILDHGHNNVQGYETNNGSQIEMMGNTMNNSRAKLGSFQQTGSEFAKLNSSEDYEVADVDSMSIDEDALSSESSERFVED